MTDLCEWCDAPLGAGAGKGRPRKYCDTKCRQLAHRARQGSVQVPAQRTAAAESPPVTSMGEEVILEILRDLQDGARELQRALPTLDGEEPLRRIAQMQEQLDGLTAAAVGRARFWRVTWARISTIHRISEDTARHRFTDRNVMRRLSHFTRGRTPGSMGTLFSSVAAERAEDGGDASSVFPDDASPPSDKVTDPAAATGAAYNRLAPILSMLIRSAKLTNKEVSERIGCSASYLSRVVTGERVPTWELTRRFARACGADPTVLRTVWESQKLSEPGRDATVVERGETSMPATQRLRTAVETLHLKAGRPAPQDLAVASRWNLGITELASLLEGEQLPVEDVLGAFVRMLGGDVRYFTNLLTDAQQEAGTLPGRSPQTVTDESGGAPPGPGGGQIDTVLKTFSTVFFERDTLQDGQARILRRLAERTQADPQAASLASRLEALRSKTSEMAWARASRPRRPGWV
ncbi:MULTISPECIES: helix-turn-helix transcriptional regulator [unclassified Streptomyces]|uniref:helix-turn-helix domain-containing protein n=1 Tax=unclassified Streptomyces TaxID=2593676 RepID=UPI00344D599E